MFWFFGAAAASTRLAVFTNILENRGSLPWALLQEQARPCMPAPSSVNPGPDIEVEPASSDAAHVDVSLGSEGYVSDPSETQSQAAHPSASCAVILYSEARAELPRAEIPRSQLEEVFSASASSHSRRGKVGKQRLDFDVKLEDYKHRYQSADDDSLVRELVVKDTQIESLAEGARKDNQKMEAFNR